MPSWSPGHGRRETGAGLSAQLPALTLEAPAAAPALSSSSFLSQEGSCLWVHLMLLLCFPDSEPLAPYCPGQAFCICVKISQFELHLSLPTVFLLYFLQSQLFLSPRARFLVLRSPYLSLSASLFVFLPALTPSFSPLTCFGCFLLFTAQ